MKTQSSERERERDDCCGMFNYSILIHIQMASNFKFLIAALSSNNNMLCRPAFWLIACRFVF